MFYCFYIAKAQASIFIPGIWVIELRYPLARLLDEFPYNFR